MISPISRAQDGRYFLLKKAADQTVNDDATINDDDTLVYPVNANSIYNFRLGIWYSSSATADIRFHFETPAGCVGDVSQIQSGVITPRTINADFSLPCTGASDYIFSLFEIALQVVATGGNFKFRWAQSASEVSNTNVRAGSYMIVMQTE